MEAQGSSGLKVDPVDAVQNVAFNIIKEKTTRFVEGAVEYVRETVGYEEGIFDVEAV